MRYGRGSSKPTAASRNRDHHSQTRKAGDIRLGTWPGLLAVRTWHCCRHHRLRHHHRRCHDCCSNAPVHWSYPTPKGLAPRPIGNRTGGLLAATGTQARQGRPMSERFRRDSRCFFCPLGERCPQRPEHVARPSEGAGRVLDRLCPHLGRCAARRACARGAKNFLSNSVLRTRASGVVFSIFQRTRASIPRWTLAECSGGREVVQLSWVRYTSTYLVGFVCYEEIYYSTT